MEGVDLATVKELLGYKSINITMRYAHLAPSHKERGIPKSAIDFWRRVFLIRK